MFGPDTNVLGCLYVIFVVVLVAAWKLVLAVVEFFF